jgi:hypothetical protein
LIKHSGEFFGRLALGIFNHAMPICVFASSLCLLRLIDSDLVLGRISRL